MPKKTDSIEEIINATVAQVTARILPAIERALAEAGSRAAQPRGPKAKPVRGQGRRRRAPEELMRWVADSRARRVPKFVIEATGLDTKKKIVARYGEDVAFEKGKPLPPLKAAEKRAPGSARETAARVVEARAPIVRKRSQSPAR